MTNDSMDLLHSIDRDLLFFFNTDDQHQQPLLFLKQKEQKKLGKLVKRVHQTILQLQRTTTTDGSSAQLSNAVSRFFQQKQTNQLYIKLVTLRDQYQATMQQLQIRSLANDRERYEQLQAIHGLSGRLDRTSQIYEELHHLHRALTLLRQEWKLDRIEHLVSTLATSSSSPPHALTERHGHHWYPLIDNTNTNNHKKRSSLFSGTIKNWFRQRQTGNQSKKETTKSTDTPPPPSFSSTLKRRRTSHPHHHSLLTDPSRIRQLIQDFRGVFEENVRQNQERMHQLYTPLFHPTDPLLAEDIQRLCLELTSAPPPTLISLHQPSLEGLTLRETDAFLAVDEMQFWYPGTTTHHQTGSFCLGLLSEHLLGVGQSYYTRWIVDVDKAQQQQTAPFQVATHTLARMYRALQIEQGYALLARLCTHLEPSLA